MSTRLNSNSSPSHRPDHPVVRSRYATLTVLVAPDDPVITQGDVFQATEDREIALECVSANGKPAAEVSSVGIQRAACVCLFNRDARVH